MGEKKAALQVRLVGLGDESTMKMSIADNDGNNQRVTISLQGHLLCITSRTDISGSYGAGNVGRTDIVQFSASSATRLRRYLRSSVAEYKNLITLTYPYGFGVNGIESKQHLRVFMQWLKRRAANDSFSALWFMEFQERGAIHYHIFTTHDCPKQAIALEWYKTCGTEDKRHLAAGTRIERIRSGRHGAAAYATKYAAKQQQKVVPKDFGWSGRFWGVSGLRITKEAAFTYEVGIERGAAVERRISAVKDQLKCDLRAGKCRKLETVREGCAVFLYKTESAAAMIRGKIELAHITLSIFEAPYGSWLGRISDYEELKGDIADGDYNINE